MTDQQRDHYVGDDPALAFWRSLFRRWRESDELWKKISGRADGERAPETSTKEG